MKQFWIFGYGSLMWRPGFEYSRREPALIRGYHRRLCVYSHVHRGTPERPGLVLGLDRGGSCHGVAFMIEPLGWSAALSYLREREQVTKVYAERCTTIELLASHERVEAVTYVVDRKHQQYAGVLPLESLLAHVHLLARDSETADRVERDLEWALYERSTAIEGASGFAEADQSLLVAA